MVATSETQRALVISLNGPDQSTNFTLAVSPSDWAEQLPSGSSARALFFTMTNTYNWSVRADLTETQAPLDGAWNYVREASQAKVELYPFELQPKLKTMSDHATRTSKTSVLMSALPEALQATLLSLPMSPGTVRQTGGGEPNLPETKRLLDLPLLASLLESSLSRALDPDTFFVRRVCFRGQLSTDQLVQIFAVRRSESIDALARLIETLRGEEKMDLVDLRPRVGEGGSRYEDLSFFEPGLHKDTVHNLFQVLNVAGRGEWVAALTFSGT